MKKVIKLTESDLTRIVKRVIKETEEGSEKEDMCVSRMKLSDATSKAKTACSFKNDTIGASDCIKVGTKSMYPKTYSKLKSLSYDYPLGCTVAEGQSLTFYENYNDWLVLFGKTCGDRLVKIPKVSPAVVSWVNKLDYPDDINWYIEGDSIYLVSFGGGC